MDIILNIFQRVRVVRIYFPFILCLHFCYVLFVCLFVLCLFVCLFVCLFFFCFFGCCLFGFRWIN
jgi:hypothetical protein